MAQDRNRRNDARLHAGVRQDLGRHSEGPVSRTRTEASHNTRVIGGSDAIDQLAALRASTDGDIGVGGATIATQLLAAGLLDELLVFTHPVVLGSGRPLFDRMERPFELGLLETAEFEGGVTMRRYAVTR